MDMQESRRRHGGYCHDSLLLIFSWCFILFHVIADDSPVVLEAAPGFVDRYLDLVEAGDGDPGRAAVLTELADYVAEPRGRDRAARPVLARCLAGRGVGGGAAPTDGAELVAWAFLDSLSPDDRRRLVGWLGPRTRSLLLHEVEADPARGT